MSDADYTDDLVFLTNTHAQAESLLHRGHLHFKWEASEISTPVYILIGYGSLGGACGVMVIVAGIGHGDTSSNPGLIAFHIALIPLGKVWIQLFSLRLWVNSRAD